MEKTVDRICKALASTREMSERQRIVVHEEIAEIVASIIAKQAKALRDRGPA